ncbi:MAG: hypothetical protein KatS3mg087_1409 [Patescibacteria group bacterium]|nr:MAG: hypothetical protein KatS3mg087_1409 [Patescibacteria group bacterium]
MKHVITDPNFVFVKHQNQEKGYYFIYYKNKVVKVDIPIYAPTEQSTIPFDEGRVHITKLVDHQFTYELYPTHTIQPFPQKGDEVLLFCSEKGIDWTKASWMCPIYEKTFVVAILKPEDKFIFDIGDKLLVYKNVEGEIIREEQEKTQVDNF